MTRRAWGALLRFWSTDQGLSVFLALLFVALFVVPSTVTVGPVGAFIADLVFSLLLIAGVASLSERRWIRLMLSVVAAAALLVRWAGRFMPSAVLNEANAWSDLAAASLFCFLVLTQVFRRGPVTRHRIEGAVAAYLLLGLAWASAYELVSLRHSGAFAAPAGATAGAGPQWLYYSFVTLTTMGYGDITPVHPAARSLAVVEALVGQLYPAILLARLVSLEVESRSARGR